MLCAGISEPKFEKSETTRGAPKRHAAEIGSDRSVREKNRNNDGLPGLDIDVDVDLDVSVNVDAEVDVVLTLILMSIPTLT